MLILNKSKKNSNLFKNKIDSKTCFGKNSIFDILYNLSKNTPAYIILLGGAHDDVVFRTTFLHYVEELIGVEYRYIKKFYEPKNKVKFVNQYVRYLSNKEYFKINKKKTNRNFPVKEKYKLLGKDLIQNNLVKFIAFNYSTTRIVKLNKFVEFIIKKLKEDKSYLLK